MAVDFEQPRFTVNEYVRMAESGVFGPDERVELIDGVVVNVPPSGPEHASVVNELFAVLLKRIGERVTLRCQTAVVLGTRSMPEPDIGVFARVEGRYRDRHPSERDALALIEISRSRPAYDRGPKLRVYARSRVPNIGSSTSSASGSRCIANPATSATPYDSYSLPAIRWRCLPCPALRLPLTSCCAPRRSG